MKKRRTDAPAYGVGSSYIFRGTVLKGDMKDSRVGEGKKNF